MHRVLLLIAPLVLLGCSRPPSQPHPADAAPSATTEAASRTTDAEGDASAVQPVDVDPLFAAVAAEAELPAGMLNAYVMALLNRDRKAIDAAWTFPPSDARRADDAALRQLMDVRSLRLTSELPVARDGHQPPQLLEVPVQIRAVTTEGTFRFGGWYRVQPSSDGRAWQIQSAQLRPTLD
ncbi:TPA: hypothetical protein QDZ62_003424 [Stenotrophomonas maltophilia]|nr:hypothetical protein [Stenotrophomonas maltophilia]